MCRCFCFGAHEAKPRSAPMNSLMYGDATHQTLSRTRPSSAVITFKRRCPTRSSNTSPDFSKRNSSSGAITRSPGSYIQPTARNQRVSYVSRVHFASCHIRKWFPVPQVLCPQDQATRCSETDCEADACDQIVRAVIQAHSRAAVDFEFRCDEVDETANGIVPRTPVGSVYLIYGVPFGECLEFLGDLERGRNTGSGLEMRCMYFIRILPGNFVIGDEHLNAEEIFHDLPGHIDVQPGKTRFAVKSLLPVGTIICGITAIAGNGFLCSVNASFIPR